MSTKSAKPQAEHRREQPKPERAQPWLNTKPRGNPETSVRDLNHSIQKLEMLVGR